MATARKFLLMFVVAMVVASIYFATLAQGAVLGQTLRPMKLQENPGTEPSPFVPLEEGTILNVNCWLESSMVVGDNWWLKGFWVNGGKQGYVVDYDMVYNCNTLACLSDIVLHCVG